MTTSSTAFSGSLPTIIAPSARQLKRSFSPSLAELRQSPLGQDLRLLAAAGYSDVSRDHVQETVGRVTDLLLRPLAAEGMVIPAWFWRSAIGKIVARAARVTYGDDGLMSVSDAADRLGVAPAIVAGWTTDGAIAMIPDEAVARWCRATRSRSGARSLASWPVWRSRSKPAKMCSCASSASLHNRTS